ncbi:MAG TPA: hypothetical protein VL120_01135 [Solirubrobacteraceae bacterium]|nr:hypothetical protein [Solirubrobacteraceae bacterium]
MATTIPEPAAPPAIAKIGGCARPQPGVVSADIGALERALADGEVTFSEVARAWFHVCDDGLPREQRERCEQLYPELLSAFGAGRGRVVTANFCRHARVAAALTDIEHAAEVHEWSKGDPRGRSRLYRNAASSAAIHVEYGVGEPVDTKAREILLDCVELHYRAIEFLTPKPRKICLQIIMGVVSSLLGILDERRCSGRSTRLDEHEITCLENVIRRARGYYDRSAQRQAQVEYFVGMAAGLVLLVAVLFGIGVAYGEEIRLQPLLYTPLAAGLGAFVSVLARMTRGQLQLSYESGRSIMRLLGLIRPLLGALFGAAIYVLLSGGLLSLAPPETSMRAQIFFFVGIAFVAGFSERFAQDMVARAPGAGATPTPSAHAPAPAPVPGPAPPVA